MEYRPIGAGVLHLFLANSEYHRRVPILATYRFFYYIYGADHQRGYFWRDIRVLPDTVDHLLRAAYREDPQCSALDANNHGRHHRARFVGYSHRADGCSDGGHLAALLCGLQFYVPSCCCPFGLYRERKPSSGDFLVRIQTPKRRSEGEYEAYVFTLAV